MSVQPPSRKPTSLDTPAVSDKINPQSLPKKPGYLKKIALESKLISNITSALQSNHKIKNSKEVAQLIDSTLHAVLDHPHSDEINVLTDEYPADILEDDRTLASLPDPKPINFLPALHEIVEKNRKHPERILEKLKPVILEKIAYDPEYSPYMHKFQEYFDDKNLQSISFDIKHDKRKEYGPFFVACLDKSCTNMSDLSFFLNVLHAQQGDLEMGLHNLMIEEPWASDPKLLESAEKLSLLPQETSRLPSYPKKSIPSPKNFVHAVVLPSFKEIVYARESDKVAQVVAKEFKKLAGETKVAGISIEEHKQIGNFDEIRAKIMEKYKDNPLKAASALKKVTLVLLARDPIYHITAFDIMKMSIAMDKHLNRAKKYYDSAGKNCHDYQLFCDHFLKNSNSLDQYTDYLQKTTIYEQERMEVKTRLSQEIAATMNDFIPGSGDTASILDVDRWVATLTTDFIERVDMKEFTDDALKVFSNFMAANAQALETLTKSLKKGEITQERFDDPKIYQELVLQELDKMGMKHAAVPFQAGKSTPEEEKFFNALSKAVLSQILQAYPTAGKILTQQVIHDIITPYLIKMINEETHPLLFYQRILFVLEKINNEIASKERTTSAIPMPYQGQELKKMAINIARFTAAALQSEKEAHTGKETAKRKMLDIAENMGIKNFAPRIINDQANELLGEVQRIKGLQLVDQAAEGLRLFREMRNRSLGSLPDNPELAKALEKECLNLISFEVQNMVRAKVGDYIASSDIVRDTLTGAAITVPLVMATYGTSGGIRGAGFLGGLFTQGAGLASKKAAETYCMLSNGLNSLWGQSAEAYDETTQKAFFETIDRTAQRIADYIYIQAEAAAKKAEAAGQPLIDAMARFHEEHEHEIQELVEKEVDLAVRGHMRHLGNQGVLKNLMYQIITDAAVNSFLPDQKDNFHKEWAAAQA